MTERLHFDYSLSCIGEGNGTHSSVLAWRIPGTGEPRGLPSLGSHSVLAWRIPGTGEPGGLPSMGSHRVGHD